MKKYTHKPIQMVLVAAALAAATAGCDRGKSEAEQKAQEATLTAAKMKAEADDTAKLKTAHVEERTKLQKDLDAQERKVAYLKQKAATAIGPTKKNADAAITEYEARVTKAKSDLSRLADETAPGWDATKKATEEDLAAVSKANEAIERTLTKK